MTKRKLQHFEEMKTFNNVFEPSYYDILNNDFILKGKWNRDYFKNNNPIVLELGCGKGEYTIALAKKNPNKNYIGIDIKGARIWKGSKDATEQKLYNVAFVRMSIENINSFFLSNEVSEIWITFPDPQLKKVKKRLSSSRFLSLYQKIVVDDCIIHLKTDSNILHKYTKTLLSRNKLKIIEFTDDLYCSNISNDILSIKTHYEKIYLEKQMKITYIKFILDKSINIKEGKFHF